MDAERFFAIFERSSMLATDSTWRGQATLDALAEAKSLEAEMGPVEKIELSPLYFSIDGDGMSGAYCIGTPDAIAIGVALADLVAGELAPDEFYGPMNYRQLLAAFGPAVVAPMVSLVREALTDGYRGGLRKVAYTRATDDDGVEIEGSPVTVAYAALDCAEGVFEEAGIEACERDAEHATICTRVNFGGAYDALAELIETREAAAIRRDTDHAALLERGDEGGTDEGIDQLPRLAGRRTAGHRNDPPERKPPTGWPVGGVLQHS